MSQYKNTQYKKALFPKNDREYLPYPIALLDGYILLAALGDPLLLTDKNNKTVFIQFLHIKLE